jgi:hypothetical protein
LQNNKKAFIEVMVPGVQDDLLAAGVGDTDSSGTVSCPNYLQKLRRTRQIILQCILRNNDPDNTTCGEYRLLILPPGR